MIIMIIMIDRLGENNAVQNSLMNCSFKEAGG
jgi:hypothetical protein